MIESCNNCIGVLAHVDAGKTTLTQALLGVSGAVRRSAPQGGKQGAWFDFHEIERRRGITVFSKQSPFEWNGKKFTLIDTPGHVDFSAETERTLSVLDCAVVVVDGVSGVQGHTQTLWRLLAEKNIPVFIFINKTDRETADRDKVFADIRKCFGDGCVDFTNPDFSACLEELAVLDDKWLEAFIEGNTDEEYWNSIITQAVGNRTVFPCVFGSALNGDGVERLLELLSCHCQYKSYPDEMSAAVYKILHDSKGNRLTFLKVTGGKLGVKIPFGDEKIDEMRIYSGEKSESVQSVLAGGVCAVTGLASTFAGQRISGETFEKSVVPYFNPMLSAQVLICDKTDLHTAFRNLQILGEELPELQVKTEKFGDEEQIQIRVMGRIQLDVLKELVAERFGMSIDFGACRIIYKETVAAPVVGYGHYEPLRHYAEVHLRIEPAARNSGISTRSECSLEVLDAPFQHLVLGHVLEKEHRGILTGSPLTDVEIVLVAGRSHLKHTEGGDFREATYRAIRQGLEKAENILLEPYYSFVLRVPSECAGRAIADIQRLHGEFEPPETDSSDTVLRGIGPVSEFMDYPEQVAAYTRGRGNISFADNGYLPCHNADEVTAQIGYKKERDIENPSSSVFCSHGGGFEVKWFDVDSYRHIK